MGIWLKDTDDYYDAERATRSGMWGALLFAAWIVFSLVMLLNYAGGLAFQILTRTEQMIELGSMGAELAIALAAAWRFRQGKGLIIGSVTLLVFVIEVVLKLVSGLFLGLLWYALYFGILLSLINGLRGAWAMRQMVSPDEAVEAFE